MTTSERLELFRQLEDRLEGRLLVYFCGDNALMGARLGEDVLRPLYVQLSKMRWPEGRPKRLVVCVHSQGGYTNSAWKIMSLLREFCDQLFLFIPYKAHSAATLLALGADKTIMTKLGSLSPIEPLLGVGLEDGPGISVHDANCYVKFIREAMAAQAPDSVTETLRDMLSSLGSDPLLLGNAYRTYNHIKVVARKLLALAGEPYSPEKQASILDTLVEKGCLHNHTIRRAEAKEIGLNVEDADGPLCDLGWQLYNHYARLLGLTECPDLDDFFEDPAEPLVPDERLTIRPFPTAYLESIEACHVYHGALSIRRERDLSALSDITLSPEVAVKLPNVGPAAATEFVRECERIAARTILQKLRAVSPVTHEERELLNAAWHDVTEDRDDGKDVAVNWPAKDTGPTPCGA